MRFSFFVELKLYIVTLIYVCSPVEMSRSRSKDMWRSCTHAWYVQPFWTSSTSSFIVTHHRLYTDPTNTTHYSRRPCLSGGRQAVSGTDGRPAGTASAQTLDVFRNRLKTVLPFVHAL